MIKCFYCGTENSETDKFCRQCGNGLQSAVTGNKPDADIELLSSHLSPKFTIEKKIGKGGMATVYLGEQTALQRKIVVKFLNKDISDDDEIRERFILEARTPARLKHPNIVEVIDVGLCDDRPYYIMEYASGGSVADKQKKYRDQGSMFPLKEAAELITKVLDALHYCHLNNLQSHRDIKPANIMYRANGEPIIVDFGIAKITDSSITRTRMTMGTANYMSPEQCQGRKDIDGRSDVYSVGIMLFELLTGDLPFKGDSGLSIMIKQVKEKMPSLSGKMKSKSEKVDPDFSVLGPELEAIIEKACAKSRKKRYQSAKEFAEALASLVGSDIPNTLKQSPIHRNLNWGLIVAMLLLGLGIGGFLGYRMIVLTYKVEIGNNIFIDTDPPGAKVINTTTNIEEGKTPFVSSKDQPGIYNYKLILDGYKEGITEIQLSDLQKKETRLVKLEADMPPLIDITDNTLNPPDAKDTKDAKDSTDAKEAKDTKDTTEVKEPVKDNGLLSYGGLLWQTSDIKQMNWYSAISYCRNLKMRLPSRNELKLIYSSGIRRLMSPCCEYWSSTPYEDEPDSAYTISVKSYDAFYSTKLTRFYVRCVAKP
ncbi:MAG: protein kinase [Leptospiraceae bacterium]|nr:protein kinase [Leptospiraceae bacterium]MBK9499776.1 protein kinase [Leptospiraceae bacterium]